MERALYKLIRSLIRQQLVRKYPTHSAHFP